MFRITDTMDIFEFAMEDALTKIVGPTSVQPFVSCCPSKSTISLIPQKRVAGGGGV